MFEFLQIVVSSTLAFTMGAMALLLGLGVIIGLMFCVGRVFGDPASTLLRQPHDTEIAKSRFATDNT